MSSSAILDRLTEEKQRALSAFADGDVPSARRMLSHAILTAERLHADEPSAACAAELGHCEYDLGVLEATAGSFTEARRLLDRAAAHCPDRSDKQRCRLQLVLLLLRTGRDEPVIAELVAGIPARWGNNDVHDQALAASVRSGIAEAERAYTTALRLLERARDASTDQLVTAGLCARIGSLLLRLGRHDEAGSELGSALAIYQSRQRHLDAALVEIERSLAAIAGGVLDEAAVTLERILDPSGYPSGRTPQDLGEASPIRARCLDLLGTIDREQGGLAKLGRAASRHTQAEGEFAAGGWTRAAAVSRMNRALDHLATQRSRSIRYAGDLLRDSVAELERGSAGSPEAADAQVARGIVLTLLNEPGGRDEAMSAFRSASDHYDAAGLRIEQTTALHNLGWLFAEEAAEIRHRGGDASSLEQEALALLIPAALARDSVRCDLAVPHHRRAWWTAHAEVSWGAALRVAFESGSTELMAELIIRARRSGTLDLAETAVAPALDSLEGLTVPTVAGRAMLSTSASSLRLVPGPRIEMPADHRLALAEYEEIATVTYGIRPEQLHSATTGAVL